MSHINQGGGFTPFPKTVNSNAVFSHDSALPPEEEPQIQTTAARSSVPYSSDNLSNAPNPAQQGADDVPSSPDPVLTPSHGSSASPDALLDKLNWASEMEGAALLWTALMELANSAKLDVTLSKELKHLLQKMKYGAARDEIQAARERIEAEKAAAWVKFAASVAAAVVTVGMGYYGAGGASANSSSSAGKAATGTPATASSATVSKTTASSSAATNAAPKAVPSSTPGGSPQKGASPTEAPKSTLEFVRPGSAANASTSQQNAAQGANKQTANTGANTQTANTGANAQTANTGANTQNAANNANAGSSSGLDERGRLILTTSATAVGNLIPALVDAVDKQAGFQADANEASVEEKEFAALKELLGMAEDSIKSNEEEAMKLFKDALELLKSHIEREKEITGYITR